MILRRISSLYTSRREFNSSKRGSVDFGLCVKRGSVSARVFEKTHRTIAGKACRDKLP